MSARKVGVPTNLRLPQRLLAPMRAPDDSALGRGLAWANQLESEARVGPSRLGLLGRWLNEIWS